MCMRGGGSLRVLIADLTPVVACLQSGRGRFGRRIGESVLPASAKEHSLPHSHWSQPSFRASEASPAAHRITQRNAATKHKQHYSSYFGQQRHSTPKIPALNVGVACHALYKGAPPGRPPCVARPHLRPLPASLPSFIVAPSFTTTLRLFHPLASSSGHYTRQF